MKLGLLGYPIEHSLSPKLYRDFLGSDLESYKLYSFESPEEIPSLEVLSEELDGLNITSPYKTHFLDQIIIESSLVKKIGAVNTLVFRPDRVVGTNTDVVAVQEILQRFKSQFLSLRILLLGSGAMGKLTELVAKDLDIPLIGFSRKLNSDISHLDLSQYDKEGVQIVIINACSRDFVFKGKFSGKEIFWDYNYSFLPHQNTLPSLVMSYQDGQEMLELQAKAAIDFWKLHNS
jgi:shikimate dehydrogenase